MLSVSTAVYISAGTAPFLAVLVVREFSRLGQKSGIVQMAPGGIGIVGQVVLIISKTPVFLIQRNIVPADDVTEHPVLFPFRMCVNQYLHMMNGFVFLSRHIFVYLLLIDKIRFHRNIPSPY